MRPTHAGLLIGMILLILAACGGDGSKLDARVLQLSVTYSVDGPSAATMTGGQGAAPAGSGVECRMAGNEEQSIGETTANEVGAFEMTLDPDAFPARAPGTEAFKQLNKTVECRSEGGAWTNPLKQPRLSIG